MIRRRYTTRDLREERFSRLCREGDLEGPELLELVDYLYRHYRPAVLLYIQRGNSGRPRPFHIDDEDILQEAFLNAMKFLKQHPTRVTCSFFSLLSVNVQAAIMRSGGLRAIVDFRERGPGRMSGLVFELPFAMSERTYYEI